MQFPRIKRGSAEVIFAVMKNNHTAALVDGDAVQMDTGAAAADLGNAVIQSPATLGAYGIVGIVWGPNIAIGDYGTILVYGVHNNAKVLNAMNAAKLALRNSATAGSLTLAVGDGTDDPNACRIGFSLAAASGNRGKVFLHCM